MIISIINHTELSKDEVQRVVRAVNRQMQEDFRRYWHKEVHLRLEGWTGEQPDPELPLDMRGDAVLYLWDDNDVENALGYHALNYQGVPYGFVFTQLADALGEPWSVTLSHEVLEMAMDAEANLLAQGPHPDPAEGGRMVYHWYELCDAVQSDVYEIDGVPVSNFLLPLYFTEGEEHQNHNDFLGTRVPSFGLAPGGYIGYFDPETGRHESYIAPGDHLAAARKASKETWRGITRADRHKGAPIGSQIENPASVRCEAITFELSGTHGGNGAALERAQQLAMSRLGAGWEIRRCAGDPNEFDALAPGDSSLAFGEAWQLSHGLEDEPDVVFAEPSLTHLITGVSDDAEAESRAGRLASGIGRGKDKPGTESRDWALRSCNVPEAWAFFEGLPQAPGEGIRIGHPDSGFQPHTQLDADRVRTDLDRDFLGRDADPSDPLGSHGLATASVIMSGYGRGGHDRRDALQGPALYAEIVPLRVTKPGFLRPAPVLLSAGMHRLRDAIDYAVAQQCGVISMSLGGLPSRAVEKAVRRAEEAGVIVLAAAGNQVRFVVWPARYESTIAVAGTHIEDGAWKGSCRGRAVDVSAPAESVWRALVADDGEEIVGRSYGTSYAVALTAGVAALWLSYHGPDALKSRYGNAVPDVFRQLLKQTARRHRLPQDEFGAGIVDAAALLEAELPPERGARAARAPARSASGDTRDALAERALGRRMQLDTDALPDALARELLCAEALGAFGSATDEPRGRAARAPATARTTGLSARLRAAIER